MTVHEFLHILGWTVAKAGSKAIDSDGMCKALEVTIDVCLMHKGMIIRSPSLVAGISSSNPTGED